MVKDHKTATKQGNDEATHNNTTNGTRTSGEAIGQCCRNNNQHGSPCSNTKPTWTIVEKHESGLPYRLGQKLHEHFVSYLESRLLEMFTMKALFLFLSHHLHSPTASIIFNSRFRDLLSRTCDYSSHHPRTDTMITI